MINNPSLGHGADSSKSSIMKTSLDLACSTTHAAAFIVFFVFLLFSYKSCLNCVFFLYVATFTQPIDVFIRHFDHLHLYL